MPSPVEGCLKPGIAPKKRAGRRKAWCAKNPNPFEIATLHDAQMRRLFSAFSAKFKITFEAALRPEM
ncbi:MAG: hypothetical protein ABJO54_19470 [Hyphomicrobiales bacterium]